MFNYLVIFFSDSWLIYIYFWDEDYAAEGDSAERPPAPRVPLQGVRREMSGREVPTNTLLSPAHEVQADDDIEKQVTFQDKYVNKSS